MSTAVVPYRYSRCARVLSLVLAFLIFAIVASAATITYEYDELGRLKKVTHADGGVLIYEFDAAGNRTQVTSGVTPGAPTSISVPSSNATGSYTINWGAASGTVSAYQLYEATNSGFSGQTLAYSGTATSKAIAGKGDGTYYYRVRACNGSLCSAYVAGANGTTVILPPGVPPWISVPTSSSTGSYTVSWGTSTGAVGSYELYEATNQSFSGQVQVYSGTGTSRAFSDKAPGTFYYQVRACNSACSAYTSGANGVTVPQPIQVLNPTIQVDFTSQLTGISTLANLNGHSATIHSFSAACSTATAQIQSGAQSVRWVNGNYYYWQCGWGWDEQCNASYVIRNSGTGQLHSGNATIVVTAQGQDLPPGYNCP